MRAEKICSLDRMSALILVLHFFTSPFCTRPTHVDIIVGPVFPHENVALAAVFLSPIPVSSPQFVGVGTPRKW